MRRTLYIVLLTWFASNSTYWKVSVHTFKSVLFLCLLSVEDRIHLRVFVLTTNIVGCSVVFGTDFRVYVLFFVYTDSLPVVLVVCCGVFRPHDLWLVRTIASSSLYRSCLAITFVRTMWLRTYGLTYIKLGCSRSVKRTYGTLIVHTIFQLSCPVYFMHDIRTYGLNTVFTN
jgi:hypothetical protein